MKFNLTITDMSEEEFANLFTNINCKPTIEPVVVTEKPEEVEPSEETINFDVDGLQWDARIHSSNHKMNSDGRWQRRRGVSDVEFNNIKNELLGVTPEPTPVAPVTPEPVVTPTQLAVENQFTPQVVAPSAEFMAAIAQPVAPVAPVVTPTPAPVVTPEINADTLYQTMFEKIKVGLANQTLKPNDIQNIVTALNATLGASYPTIAAAKGNVSALQFVINELTVRGL